jgi:para-nitrobenzyl esterase
VLHEPFGAAQLELAQQMIGAWSAFVRDGSPGAVSSVAWPRYDTQARQVLYLEPGATRLTQDFRERHHCEYWRTLPATPAPSATTAAGTMPVPLDLTSSED